MALEVTDANFEELVNAGKPMVLDFWAEWCGPCRMLGPVIEQLADEYEGQGVIIGKVNVDEESELVTIYYGSDVSEEDAISLLSKAQERFPDCEIELQDGGQPIYYYLISVE